MFYGQKLSHIRTALVLIIGTCVVLMVTNNNNIQDLNIKNSMNKRHVIQLEAETSPPGTVKTSPPVTVKTSPPVTVKTSPPVTVKTSPPVTVKSKKPSDSPQLRDGAFQNTIELKGMLFGNSTEITSDYEKEEFGVTLTISVVKSFSPDVEEHVKKIFNDEYGECKFYATLPAMVKRNGGVEVIQRIWLGQYEKMSSYYKRNAKTMTNMVYEWKNTWQENYLYSMQLDEDYNLIKPGSIMGLPTTTNAGFTYKSDGPMDPRLFTVGDNTYLSFHTWLVDPTYNHKISSRVHLYDIDRHVKKKLTLNIDLHRTEINWIPVDVNGELYYTYSLDPLRVMKCNPQTAACKFIYEQEGTSKNPFVYSSDHLRGGSPWILYKYPYYISVGHNVVVTRYPHDDFSLYNSNMVVMSVEPWRIVYVSRNIQYNQEWLNSTPVIRNQTILKPFFYPCGIILRNPDVIDVSGHLNDAVGHIIRIRGIKKLMDNVINEERQHPTHKPAVVRNVQQYVMESSKFDYKTWKFAGDILNHSVEQPSYVSS